jgi:hypothetical protein
LAQPENIERHTAKQDAHSQDVGDGRRKKNEKGVKKKPLETGVDLR